MRYSSPACPMRKGKGRGGFFYRNRSGNKKWRGNKNKNIKGVNSSAAGVKCVLRQLISWAVAVFGRTDVHAQLMVALWAWASMLGGELGKIKISPSQQQLQLPLSPNAMSAAAACGVLCPCSQVIKKTKKLKKSSPTVRKNHTVAALFSLQAMFLSKLVTLLHFLREGSYTMVHMGTWWRWHDIFFLSSHYKVSVTKRSMKLCSSWHYSLKVLALFNDKHVLLIPTTHTIFSSLKISEGLIFVLNDNNFMNTCSFTIHFKKISTCSKVFVEWFKILYAKVNSARMNSACKFIKIVVLWTFFSVNMARMNNTSNIFWWH